VTEQLEVGVEPTWASAQVVEPKLPVPLEEKVTVPCGHDFGPESVSETVAVQLVESSIGTDAGVQLTTVAVERLVTVSANVPLLDAWSALEASSYVPVIVCVPVPTAVGVYVAEHELVKVPGLPSEASVQVSPGTENAPAPELEKVAVPVGSDFVPEPVSVTVAVHTESWPTATLPGTQLTAVEVGR
jgi:hypothetical protein